MCFLFGLPRKADPTQGEPDPPSYFVPPVLATLSDHFSRGGWLITCTVSIPSNPSSCLASPAHQIKDSPQSASNISGWEVLINPTRALLLAPSFSSALPGEHNIESLFHVLPSQAKTTYLSPITYQHSVVFLSSLWAVHPCLPVSFQSCNLSPFHFCNTQNHNA